MKQLIFLKKQQACLLPEKALTNGRQNQYIVDLKGLKTAYLRQSKTTVSTVPSLSQLISSISFPLK